MGPKTWVLILKFKRRPCSPRPSQGLGLWPLSLVLNCPAVGIRQLEGLATGDRDSGGLHRMTAGTSQVAVTRVQFLPLCLLPGTSSTEVTAE